MSPTPLRPSAPRAAAELPLKRRGLPAAPLIDLPLPGAEETPFLRPKSRTRVRRARRGFAARTVLTLQLMAALVFAVGLVWTGYAKVMASDRLKVARVNVRGSHFLSEGEVRELLGPAVGENILGLDIDSLKARLRASPWVADATVRRTLPDMLQVEVHERVPLALAEVDRLYLMDGEGALIDIYGPRTSGFDLPIVRGLAGIDGEQRRVRAERAGGLLADLGDLAAEISEVHVEDGGDLRIVLRGAGEVLRMGAPPYRGKFTTFLALRRELAERCPKAEYFDLRFRDRIFAKQPVEPKEQAVPVATTRPTRVGDAAAAASAPGSPEQGR
jgi:cell division protein FtsQ